MSKQRKGSRSMLLAGALLMLSVLLGACGTDQPAGGLVQTAPGFISTGTEIAGMNTCMGCHSTQKAAWEQTRHANLNSSPSFTTGSCAVCHDKTGDSQYFSPVRMVVGCEGCHGLGGGPDGHVAKGGMAPIGNAAIASSVLGAVPVSAQFNTCTYCHELLNTTGTGTAAPKTPGFHLSNPARNIIDTHYATALATYGSITIPITGYAMDYASERVCIDCHNPHGIVNINQDWAASAHGDKNGTKFGYFSGAWGRRNWSTSASCQRCHTTTGFIAYADAFREGNLQKAKLISDGDASVRPIASDTKWKPEMLKCNGCHTDNKGSLRNPGPVTTDYSYLSGTYVVSSAYYTYPDVDNSNVCMACHTGRENGDTIKNLSLTTAPTITTFRNLGFINSHYLTGGGTVFTATGYEFSGRSYANPASYQHNQIGVNDFRSTGTAGPCVGCHMSRPNGNGDHLFLPVSRLNYARYKAGSVTVIAGSAIVTGASTSWLSAGIDTATDEFLGPDNRPYLIASVDSDTQITLTTPWSASYSAPTLSGPGSFYAIAQTGPRIIGIASEVCYNCHAGATSSLVDQINEERESFEEALFALEYQLDRFGICFLESNPYFYKRRWNQGTVSMTTGSTIVTGTSNSWLIISASTTTYDRFRAYDGEEYQIASIDSDTQLTLRTPYLGTTSAGQSYVIAISGSSNVTKDWDPKAMGESVGRDNFGAAFNFNLLEHDPGAYIHNRAYVKRLLYDSIDIIDDGNLNYSVGATLNALGPEPFKLKAMQYILPNGVLGIPAERP